VCSTPEPRRQKRQKNLRFTPKKSKIFPHFSFEKTHLISRMDHMRGKNKAPHKRVLFSAIAKKTHQTLLLTILVASGVLFIMHLFLMNHVMIKGIVITEAARENITLKEQTEQLDAQIARLQTQEFLGKASNRNNLIFREPTHYYVIVPAERYTAQAPDSHPEPKNP
jgi:cell division protein FtsB